MSELMRCPFCQCAVPISAVGKSVNGEPITCWHMIGEKECPGSFRPRSDATKILRKKKTA